MSVKNKLYGAILGDLAGQPYEFPAKGGPKDVSKFNIHNPDSHITDDTVMTLASAKWLLDGSFSIEQWYKRFGSEYPNVGYGKGFKEWLATPLGTPGYSWGNGCLMRLSPFMYSANPLVYSMESTMTSHRSKEAITSVIELYNVYAGYEGIGWFEVDYFTKFEVRSDLTFSFCNTMYTKSREKDTSLHETIKEVIAKGGDTDTNASIVAELINFKDDSISKEDVKYVESKLDPYLLSVLRDFNKKFK